MIISDVRSSLLGICNDFLTANPTLLVTPEVVVFDRYGDPADMPDTDTLGIMGMSVVAEHGWHFVQVMLGVSTHSDSNLFRMTDAMDALYELFQPEADFPIKSAQSGAVIGRFDILEGARLMPVQRIQTRPAQFIMVQGNAVLQP